MVQCINYFAYNNLKLHSNLYSVYLWYPSNFLSLVVVIHFFRFYVFVVSSIVLWLPLPNKEVFRSVCLYVRLSSQISQKLWIMLMKFLEGCVECNPDPKIFSSYMIYQIVLRQFYSPGGNTSLGRGLWCLSASSFTVWFRCSAFLHDTVLIYVCAMHSCN